MPEIGRQTHDALEEIIVIGSEMSKTQENLTVEWKDLNWRKLEVRVFQLQKRIFRASQRGDIRAVRRLQKTLMRSRSGKCMAVRKVSQDNQGKLTAGVDGIIHESLEFVEYLQQQIESWLTGMGLELNPSKTHICHTSEGFNFLGFNVRQYKVGAYKAAHNGHGQNLGFNTLITPSQEAVKRHLDSIGKVIDAHHNAPQEALISRLNPVIRGWCNYYSTVVSKETYKKCAHLTYQKLLAWAKRRCTNSNAHDTVSNYWRTIGTNKWDFATNNGLRLIKHPETPIVRHIKVQGARSPFDGDMVYWGQRMRNHPELPTKVKKLLTSQNGMCGLCELKFKDGDTWEIDHRIPTLLGGLTAYSNLQLLHRHCHHAKTSRDGSKGTHNKRQRIEEPCVVKVTSTVLNERREGQPSRRL